LTWTIDFHEVPDDEDFVKSHINVTFVVYEHGTSYPKAMVCMELADDIFDSGEVSA